MPKLRESPEYMQKRMFDALVAKNMTLCGYNHNKDLAPKMRMHERTLNYKLRNPELFTMKEFQLLMKTLKFTHEEKSMII